MNDITDKQYIEIEAAVYNIFDMIPIIQDYCAHNRECNGKIAYLEPMLNSMFNEFYKIAAKF